jgi:hypothetical protein
MRFDASGALYRLTSVGWESACSFAVCGDSVTGTQLSNLLTSNYPAIPGDPSRRCGPDWDVRVGTESLGADASTPETCTLNAYAPCAGGGTESNDPPGVAPWSVEVAYSRCAP